MISENPWEDKLVNAKTIWHYPGNGPHAAYTQSDQHADFYFNSDYFASNPSLVSDAAAALIERLNEAGLDDPPFWIVSYSSAISASLVLAASVSAKLNKRLAYLDIRTETINFPITTGSTAIIVTDDIYSGGSIRKIIKYLQDHGTKTLSPILTVANFFGADQLDGLKIVSLIDRTLNTWPSTSCLLCQTGSPAIPARGNWQKLVSLK